MISESFAKSVGCTLIIYYTIFEVKHDAHVNINFLGFSFSSSFSRRYIIIVFLGFPLTQIEKRKFEKKKKIQLKFNFAGDKVACPQTPRVYSSKP